MGPDVEVHLYSLFNIDTKWGRVVNTSPQPFYSRVRDTLLIAQEAGVSQGLSGPVQKILPPQGFDPRTVKPVSRYNDYGIPVHSNHYHINYYLN